MESYHKFAQFLDLQNITVEVIGKENIPNDGRFIFVSNHPLGGIDGILFYATVGKMFPNSKFLVNDLLMNLPGVEAVFLPINKHGGNSKEYFKLIDSALESDNQILSFPAGMCSRKIDGEIKDLPWKKSFISYAKKYERDIIPVHINDKNSKFFYNFANFRTKMGIKANLEMFFLVDEVYKKTDKTIQIIFGKPIPYNNFDSSKKIQEWVEEVRSISYGLKENI